MIVEFLCRAEHLFAQGGRDMRFIVENPRYAFGRHLGQFGDVNACRTFFSMSHAVNSWRNCPSLSIGRLCLDRIIVIGAVNGAIACAKRQRRSEEHTSELQSLMRISYAVFCLKKKKT